MAKIDLSILSADAFSQAATVAQFLDDSIAILGRLPPRPRNIARIPGTNFNKTHYVSAAGGLQLTPLGWDGGSEPIVDYFQLRQVGEIRGCMRT